MTGRHSRSARFLVAFVSLAVAIFVGVAVFATYVNGQAVAARAPIPFDKDSAWDSAWTDQGLILGSAASVLTVVVLILLAVAIRRRHRPRSADRAQSG